MEDLTTALGDISLQQVNSEIKQELRKGHILLDEIERFTEYAQKQFLYRRQRIEFRDIKNDIKHDLRGLESVRLLHFNVVGNHS
jgi:hypothetical protein